MTIKKFPNTLNFLIFAVFTLHFYAVKLSAQNRLIPLITQNNKILEWSALDINSGSTVFYPSLGSIGEAPLFGNWFKNLPSSPATLDPSTGTISFIKVGVPLTLQLATPAQRFPELATAANVFKKNGPADIVLVQKNGKKLTWEIIPSARINADTPNALKKKNTRINFGSSADKPFLIRLSSGKSAIAVMKTFENSKRLSQVAFCKLPCRKRQRKKIKIPDSARDMGRNTTPLTVVFDNNKPAIGIPFLTDRNSEVSLVNLRGNIQSKVAFFARGFLLSTALSGIVDTPLGFLETVPANADAGIAQPFTRLILSSSDANAPRRVIGPTNGIPIQAFNGASGNTQQVFTRTARIGASGVSEDIVNASGTNGQSAVIPAFPGAEGAGTITTHGRGGRVVEVTNLFDKGPGSLRFALEKVKQRRIIVFKIGGEIQLRSPIVIRDPFVMIAGQTAPGDGIMITGKQLVIATHDVVVRHMRFRPDGFVKGKRNEIDGLEIFPNWPLSPFKKDFAFNIVIDHCSISWGSDENVSTNGNTHDVTFQWNIISEGLHQIPGTGRGLIISPKSRDISVHHNLFAHNAQRNPLSRGARHFDFRNNVIYNWRFAGVHLQEGWAPFEKVQTFTNIVSNFFKPGRDTESSELRFEQTLPVGSGIFIRNNLGPTIRTPGTDNWDMFFYTAKARTAPPRSFRAGTEYGHAAVTTTNARTAFRDVLSNAGARLPRLDVVDQRVIADTQNGTGRIPVNNIADRGGYPKFNSSPAYVDSDKDGMPDSWETQFGLNPQNGKDGSVDNDGDGYTNVEEFLNGTAP